MACLGTGEGEMGSLPIDYNAKHTLSNIFSIGSFIDRLKEHGTDAKCISNFNPQILRTLESIRALENIGALIDFNGVGRGRGELKTFEK